MDSKTYQIRKTILKALSEYGGTPCGVIDVADHPSFLLIKPSLPEIETEWKQLKAFGYIEPCHGFDGQYFRITEKGLEQVNVEFKKDPFIHGPRFA
ncbi:MAG: hypothetical protein PHH77_05285 [Victivallaceae bacterium]|nr:hypothetical protein [Victivallaceae bacterium]